MPRHRQGFPCCVRSPLPCVLPPLPRRSGSVPASLASRPVAAFPVEQAGRLPHYRKHAIRVLNGRAAMPTVPRGRRCVYDEAVTEGLIVLWEASDRMCGKRLKALLPILVPALKRHGHLSLDPGVRERLMAGERRDHRPTSGTGAGRDCGSAPTSAFTPGRRARERAGAHFRAIGSTPLRASSRPTSSRTAAGRWPAVSSRRWCSPDIASGWTEGAYRLYYPRRPASRNDRSRVADGSFLG